VRLVESYDSCNKNYFHRDNSTNKIL
jgi:hypothetical protein